MNQEPAGGEITIDDLPDNVRTAIQNGFRAGYWFGDRGDAGAGADDAVTQLAYDDGRRLAEAVSMLISADLADYAADEARYESVATELNERYGDGLVVRSHELRSGSGPGFRSRNEAVS